MAHSSDAEGFEAGWPVLQSLIEESAESLTRKKLLDSWPEDEEPPSKTTLIRWLERAERDGLVERRGSGRNHDPYLYSLSALEPRSEAV